MVIIKAIFLLAIYTLATNEFSPCINYAVGNHPQGMTSA